LIQALKELRELGYSLELVEGRIKLTWEGEGLPDQEKVTPLLESLKRNKTEAIKLLEAGQVKPKPFLDAEGDLVIPSNCDPRYQWWAGGQSISDTLKELTREEMNSTKGDEK